MTLTVLDSRRKALAEDMYDNGIVLEREGRVVPHSAGPEFMRALLRPWSMSYYAFVDESDTLAD
ncbi:hypothetical protein EV193_101483 [Herbihabitans rhizosphaerae]|uniref:Uncharacterized protein n=1 Tax=Herbihabitans rhizosphaerae TaxID=1872711 RepID=A0A4Q7L5J9_9PSEU|nr:hypothetical protein EV193_101483 [Herbihabitans rhizosphaerae]